MGEAPGGIEANPSTLTANRSFIKQRKGFISPTSSFVDFGTLENEYYTEEGRETADFYNPHQNRELKRPTTDFEAATHLLKGSVGAGLLAMPKAFSHVGVVFGFIITVIITFLCVYAMDVLLSMQYIQCQRLRTPFIPLPASMRIGFKNGPRRLRCFASIAPLLVDIFLISCQLGFCTAYIIFIASSIKQVVEPRFVEDLNLKLYILMIFIPVCLTNYIRDLKKLMPLSLLANILILFSLGCCLYYIFCVGRWNTDTVKMVVPVQTWPLFVGTVLFALEAVGVIIALEHNMKNPEHFLGCRGIFPWCMLVVSFLYVFIGLIGYLKYGEDVKETIFASLPKDDWLALTVYAIYGFCIFLTYPLQCFVSLEILWGNYIRHVVDDPLKEFIVEYILRTVTVLITFIAALTIPQIDIVISLIGALCISCLGMIFPFTLELVTRYPNDFGRWNWILIKDIILILLGFGILVIGTYTSLYTFLFS
ncbi:proton-coupled amino acid transporter-like protein CG1139 isoform X2 [Macrosteles quadrilineatus]|uniref:proton-coupled amino acid transporter-like protein CG1139 isoform X2 n=1 Tax=Macrosteles quadrilineatus TaxID=74068 RepID=UPI0023E1FCA3|nr:proton-coupled amino acid transporter-like protein CG1139 isoform X2 [Macrosteles quadrilineatus]